MFYIECETAPRMNIPVFHDHQHGTAIISTAAYSNGLRNVEKNISDVRDCRLRRRGGGNRLYEILLVALDVLAKYRGARPVRYLQRREPNMAETKAVCVVDDSGKAHCV